MYLSSTVSYLTSKAVLEVYTPSCPLVLITLPLHLISTQSLEKGTVLLLTNISKKSDTRYIYDWSLQSAGLNTLTVLIKSSELTPATFNNLDSLRTLILPCLSTFGTSRLDPTSISDLILEYNKSMSSSKVQVKEPRHVNCSRVKLNNFNVIKGKRGKFFQDVKNVHSCIVTTNSRTGGWGGGGDVLENECACDGMVLTNLDKANFTKLKEVRAMLNQSHSPCIHNNGLGCKRLGRSPRSLQTDSSILRFFDSNSI